MNQENKWVFIINPIAGNGFATNLVPKLKEQINKYQINADLVFTERVGHATELSRQYAEIGYKYIIGVGGDGTLNEVSIPLINNKDVILGIVPCGTGNDFIQILGFPDRFEEKHWEIFFEKNTILMDVGDCNGKYFINGMGLGFDAEAAAQNYVEPGVVKQGGKNKYVWQIVKTLLFFKEKQMKVFSKGTSEETEVFINTISIGRRFAGGFFLTPKAIANDGLLDVCMIKKLNLIQRFKILLMVPKGTHINDKKVNYYQTEKLDLEFSQEVPFHLDGELNYSSTFKVSVLPSALNVIYNPQGSHYFN